MNQDDQVVQVDLLEVVKDLAEPPRTPRALPSEQIFGAIDKLNSQAFIDSIRALPSLVEAD